MQLLLTLSLLLGGAYLGAFILKKAFEINRMLAVAVCVLGASCAPLLAQEPPPDPPAEETFADSDTMTVRALWFIAGVLLCQSLTQRLRLHV